MPGGLLSIVVLQVLTVLVGLLRAKGLALALGPAGFGVASTIDQVVLTVVTLGAVAVPFTAMKFMARSHSEDPASFQATGAGFLRLVLTLGLVTAGVAFVAVMVWPALFGTHLAAYGAVLQLAVLGIPSAMLLILFVNTFAAAQRPATGAAVNLLSAGALGLAAIIGAELNGLAGMYRASVAVAVLTGVAGFAYLARSLGIRITTPGVRIVPALRAQPEIVGYSLCFYAMIAASNLTLLVSRTMVLGRLGEVAGGQLQALLSVSLTVGAVMYPLSNLYLAPLVNRRTPVAEKAQAAHSFAGRMLIVLLLGALPVVLFPGLLLRTLYSGAFVPAAGVLWLFVLWQCVFQSVYVYQQLLIGLDDVLYAAMASVAGFLTAILLNMLLVQWVGLGGVALALGGGVLCGGAAVAVRLSFRHGIRLPRRVLVRLGGAMTVVAAAARMFQGQHEVGARALAARGGFAALVLFLAFWSLDAEERHPTAWLAILRGARSPAS